jgi:hypothetical protein
MQSLVNQVGYRAEEVLMRMADELIDNMKQVVPKDSGTLSASLRKVDVTERHPGFTRPSVLVFAGGKTTTRRGADGQIYDYALGVEFGTVNEPPQPFFYSTFRYYQNIGRALFGDTIAEVIADNNSIRSARSENYKNESFGLSEAPHGSAVFHKGAK